MKQAQQSRQVQHFSDIVSRTNGMDAVTSYTLMQHDYVILIAQGLRGLHDAHGTTLM